MLKKGTTMHSRIKPRLLRGILVGMVMTILSIAPDFVADAKAEMKPLPGSNIVYNGEQPVHPGYPHLFDKVGRIDRMSGRQAVIDDSLHQISPTATYHTPRHHNVSAARFHVGDIVGCLTNSDGEIESIWLIARNKR
jgi:hypothetical protein